MPDVGKLLIVDDVELNRAILSNVFCDDYEIVEAVNGKEALDYISEHSSEIVAVLLDLVMPVTDGFGVLREMNRTGLINSIPVILITGEDGEKMTLDGYRLAAADYIRKPFNSDIVFRRVKNLIDLYSHKRNMEEKLVAQKAMLEKQSTKLKRSNQFVIDALSTTVEFRSMESGEHIKRIRLLMEVLLEKLADSYNLTPDDIESIANASAVHDIGKIAIPDSILMKPGPLTKEEFEIMKTHTIRGCEILENLRDTQDDEYFKYCYDICRYHHERWDGKGYPDGLSGDRIPVWAQVCSIADVYDALTSKRVYKEAYSHEDAMRMIMDGECGQFNPVMLKYFVDASDRLKATEAEE